MSNLTLDLTTLTEDQLAALSLVSPDAVAAERQRRFLYPDLETALAALNQAHVHLHAVVEGYRGTPAVQAVRETGILQIGDRFLKTLSVLGYAWKAPEAIPTITPKRRKMQKEKV